MPRITAKTGQTPTSVGLMINDSIDAILDRLSKPFDLNLCKSNPYRFNKMVMYAVLRNEIPMERIASLQRKQTDDKRQDPSHVTRRSTRGPLLLLATHSGSVR